MDQTKLLFPKDSLQRLKHLIEGKKNIVIFPHTAPDGDALGSTIAWKQILLQVLPQANITIISPDRIERYLRWLPHLDQILIYPDHQEEADKIISSADLIFHLDHNQISRLRYPDLIQVSTEARATRIMIDHHLYPEESFDLIFSYPTFSSTCELVTALTYSLGWESYICKETATLLTTGIITDTGRFMYSCFSPELYKHFSNLLDLGADYAKIIDRLSYHGTLEELKLKGYILHEKLEVYPDLGAAVITLSQEEIQARNISKGDTEGLVNLPLSVEGIDCVCFIREDKTQIKLSLRSTGTFPVNIIAQEGFGGGGHLNAAGGEYQGSINDAREEFITQLKLLRQQHKTTVGL